MNLVKAVLAFALGLSIPAMSQQTRYAWAVDSQDVISRYASQWGVVGGLLVNVSVAQDNTVWGVSRPGEVWRWNGSGWDKMPGILTQISVGSATEIWGVNANNEIYRWNVAANNWDRVGGVARYVSVAADGAVWVLGTGDDIYLWTGYNWQVFNCKVHQISAGASQNVWGVDATNRVLRYSTLDGSQRWDFMPGSLKQVSAAADGEVWGINMTDDLVRWNGSGWDSLGKKAAQVSVGPAITGQHTVYPTRAWLNPALNMSASLPMNDPCPAGWRLPTKPEFDSVLAFAKTQADPAASLTSGFGATAGQNYLSSTPTYPGPSVGDLNSWKFWALFPATPAVAPLNTAFPSSADASDGTLPSAGIFARCTLLVPPPVSSDIAACSTQFTGAPDLRTFDVSTIQSLDLGRTISSGTSGFGAGQPVAPLTPKPQGGAYINYLGTDKRAKIMEIDARGNAVGTDQDLGPATGVAGVGTDGTTNAYLVKVTDQRLEFRVAGGAAPTVIMDNDVPANNGTVLFSGRGVRWATAPDNPPFGTQAMINPVTMHRAVVLPAGGKWFAVYDHANNFNAYANPPSNDVHYGVSITSFNADGSAPVMTLPWGTSHSIDMRTIFDGTRLIQLSLGDAFPTSIQARVVDPATASVTATSDLFQSSKFPDTQIGASNGQPIYGIAANGGGGVSGKLGDLVPVGCGQYALTYTIYPASYNLFGNPLTSTVNEMGLLILDKDLNVVKRAMLRRGDDVDVLKTARYGKSAIFVAWKTNGAEDYWSMLIDVRGTMVQSPQRLPAGIKFAANDGFVTLANGDIMWTNREGNALKLYRFPVGQ